LPLASDAKGTGPNGTHDPIENDTLGLACGRAIARWARNWSFA
jgi:hypothetical protein